jgi:tRNA-dihydrouridine synthase A
LGHVDGVMLGREAYHHPWSMAGWDARFFGEEAAAPQRDHIEHAMLDYLQRLASNGQPWSHAARHMLGLWNGTPGARRWRQVWSDHRLKDLPPAQVAGLAREARLVAVPDAAIPA